MDVNQASTIASIHQDPKKQHNKRDPHDHANHEPEPVSQESGSWRERAAFELDSDLIDGVSAEAQKIINSLSGQIEPLRAALELANGREAHLRELAARHVVLDIPNRREFMRELTHMLTHLDDVTEPPALMVLHLVGTDRIRQQVGRFALDRALADVVSIWTGVLQPADILGSLCGSDFGVLLLSEPASKSAETLVRLRDAVSTQSFCLDSHTMALNVIGGSCRLRPGMTAQVALESADREIRSHIADQAMMSGNI